MARILIKKETSKVTFVLCYILAVQEKVFQLIRSLSKYRIVKFVVINIQSKLMGRFDIRVLHNQPYNTIEDLAGCKNCKPIS
jgi:hypothetical protein